MGNDSTTMIVLVKVWGVLVHKVAVVSASIPHLDIDQRVNDVYRFRFVHDESVRPIRLVGDDHAARGLWLT